VRPAGGVFYWGPVRPAPVWDRESKKGRGISIAVEAIEGGRPVLGKLRRSGPRADLHKAAILGLAVVMRRARFCGS